MACSVDVLVIGAGPVGLFCASELNRHGLRCRIIDKKSQLSDKSKALGLHIRTLDVFNDCDILEEVLKQGLQVKGVEFKTHSGTLGAIDFVGIEANRHFLIDLPQDKTERILNDHLVKSGSHVEWETELKAVSQSHESILADILLPSGKTEQIESKWLIACDGAHSTVRHCCNLPFEGAEYHQNWWLADLMIDWDNAEDLMQIYPSKAGPLACFPMGNKRYRLVLTAPPNNNRDPDMHDIEKAFQERASDKAKLSNPIWITKFYIHHRQIQKYRVGRIFFAGDAAHIHSPLGGQGLNTGIQDAYNLVWKLALVQKGKAHETLLDSYHLERYPVGREVLRRTDQMTRMILIKKQWLIALRNRFMSWLLSIHSFRKQVASTLAELEISYKHSPIVKDFSQNKQLQAGQFLVDFKLTAAHKKTVQSLSAIVKGTRHHLFFFEGQMGPLEPGLAELASEVATKYADEISVHLILNPSTKISAKHVSVWYDEHNFQKLKRVEKTTAILLRPDKYMGLVQSPIDKSELYAYFEQLFVQG